MLNASESVFVDSFRSASTLARIPEKQIDSAAPAVAEIFRSCEDVLCNARTLDPYFASHDTQHPIRLGELLSHLLKSAHVGKPVLSIDALVLLYVSFLLHDIGMCLEPTTIADLSIENIWSGHKIRPKHDERSREFIESKLLKESTTLHAWSAFWDAQHREIGGPLPGGQYALYLVARICQAHGDPAEDWLSSEQLSQYTLLTQDKIISFPTEWGRSWGKSRGAVEAAAALLSLLDLCDIAVQRFPRLPDPLLSRALPDGDQLAVSFMHWLGHMTTRLSFGDRQILLEVAGSDVIDLGRIMPVLIGPGADLLRWGNTPRLQQLLRDRAGIELERIQVSSGAADLPAWRSVREEAKRVMSILGERPGYHVLRLNQSLAADCEALDACFLYPLWWRAAASFIQKDFDDVGRGAFQPLELIIRTRSAGLVVENLYEPTVPLASRVLAVRPNPSDTDATLELSNGFLAALRIARDIMEAGPHFGAVRLAIKGNHLHRELRAGALPTNTITLVRALPLSSGALSEYRQMARNAATEATTALLFFGDGQTLEALLSDGSAAACPCGVRSERLETLLRDAGGIVERDGTVTILPGMPETSGPLGTDDSPASILLRLYSRGSGTDALRMQLVGRSDDVEESATNLGLVLLVTLYDLLAVVEPRVARERIEHHYSQIRALLQAHCHLPGFSSALRTFMEAGQLTAENGHVAERVPRDLLRELVTRASTSNQGLLIQVVAYLQVESEGTVYNVQSVLFAANILPIRPNDRLCDAIFDSGVPIAERTLVGFGLAEHLGSRGTINLEALLVLSQGIAKRATKFTGESGMIAFQMSYRICRALHARDLLGAAAERLLAHSSDVVSLGLLEAIASHLASETAPGGQGIGGLSEQDRSILNALDSYFASQAQSTMSTKRRAAMMAFDIMWRYRLVPAAADALKLEAAAVQRHWPIATAYFHDAAPPQASQALLRSWAAMRSSFLNVLDATPAELRREALPKGARGSTL